ncbi:4Fe-4S binding protein [Prevotella sp. LMAG:51]|uniref:4Fe-4S binding protein n=1 Tax=Prevotella sp. LMAG:51 TaxID=1969564 RepID=UPI00338E1349
MQGSYPTANDNCTGCGTCASECPAGAISPDNLRGNDNGLCIGCMRCVAVCRYRQGVSGTPQHACGASRTALP